tara:strand:+ start:21630 stop:21962 length:333 start_codon:yes stop_codon:yes gene_type:complete
MACLDLKGIEYKENMMPASIYINSLKCLNVDDSVKALAIKYYAAHLAWISNPDNIVKRKKFGVSEIENNNVGSGFMSSIYGQTANELLGGCLENSAKKKPSVFFAGGCSL